MATAHNPTNAALYPQTEGETETQAAMQLAWMAKHYPERFTALNNPRGVFKGTREEWLEAAAVIMGGWIDYALSQRSRISLHKGRLTTKLEEITLSQWLVKTYGGKPSDYRYNPKTTRFACSLMGGGMTKSGELAHIHFMHATGNKYDEIRMSVELGGRGTKDESCRVADVLLHEMIHSCARFHGHQGAFKHLATTMGLKGKMTATIASEDLRLRIWDDVVSVLGRYPHREVKLTPRGQRGKGSRLIKCTCAECGFNMRTTRKWLLAAYTEQGHISCPIGHGTPMIHPEWDAPAELLGDTVEEE
jgi:hypothetical protein